MRVGGERKEKRKKKRGKIEGSGSSHKITFLTLKWRSVYSDSFLRV